MASSCFPTSSDNPHPVPTYRWHCNDHGSQIERRREFDAHEIYAFAAAFDLPLVWFFLPPPADHRSLRNSTETVSELYGIVFGREDQLGPVYDRLRQIGIEDPNELDRTIEAISGQPSPARKTSYRERRKEMLLALLDDRSDAVDKAADELGEFFDHLRQVGIRGFVAERLHDADYNRSPEARKKYAKPSPTPPTPMTE